MHVLPSFSSTLFYFASGMVLIYIVWFNPLLTDDLLIGVGDISVDNLEDEISNKSLHKNND